MNLNEKIQLEEKLRSQGLTEKQIQEEIYAQRFKNKLRKHYFFTEPTGVKNLYGKIEEEF